MNRYLSRCQPSSAAPPANRWRGIAISFGSVYCRAGAIVLLSLTVGAPLAAQSQNTSPSVPSPQSTVTDEARPTLKLGSQGAPVSNLQGVLKLLGFYTGTIDGLYQESTAEAVAAFQQAAGLQPDGIAGTETWNRLLPVAPAISQTTAGQTTAGQTGQPAPTLPATPSRVTPTPSPSPPGTASSFPAPTATPTPAISPTPTAVRPSPSPTAASTPAPSPSPGYIPATPSPAPLPTSPTPTASTSTATPILRLGMTGTDVRRLQERLRAIGLFTGAVDGIFGSETELAVQQAQRNYNLEPDGVVGPATWEALLQGS